HGYTANHDARGASPWPICDLFGVPIGAAAPSACCTPGGPPLAPTETSTDCSPLSTSGDAGFLSVSWHAKKDVGRSADGLALRGSAATPSAVACASGSDRP